MTDQTEREISVNAYTFRDNNMIISKDGDGDFVTIADYKTLGAQMEELKFDLAAARAEVERVCILHKGLMQEADRRLEESRAEVAELRGRVEDCPLCKGTGQREVISFVDHAKTISKSCPQCKGSGKLNIAITSQTAATTQEGEGKCG